MSRIAGLLSPGSTERILLAMMAGVMREGIESPHVVTSRGAFIGWSGSCDPTLSAENGRIVAVDGAIYNPEDLDHGENDAVRIMSSIRREVFPDLLIRLLGDFSIAFFDATEETLWLARDRFGVKPLYYVHLGEKFAFASRPASLLALDWVTPEPDRSFVGRFAGCHYRYFDNDPHASPYRDIRQIPAGHWLRWHSGRIDIGRYWGLENLSDLSDPEEELAERLRELLEDAVRRRMARSVCPAFTLSGGMDSSSVLAMAVKITGSKQHAFSSVYDDLTYDESAEIRSMLPGNVRQWNPVQIGSSGIIPLVRKMISIHDEPVATATWLSHYILCDQVSQAGFSGLFGGLGGDELNAGEYEYFPLFFADLETSGQEHLLNDEIRAWAENHDHPIHRKNREVALQMLARLSDSTSPGTCLPDRHRMLRYADAIDPAFFDLSKFEPVLDNPFGSCLKNRAYQDLFRETLPCCLRADDRNSTHHGLDRFLPFLDHRVCEFMFRIPGHLKIRNGVTKHLLRRSMEGILPEETRARIDKTGWNAPAHIWFHGEHLEELLDLVRSRAFRERGIYRRNEVERIIDEHTHIINSGINRENHMMFLWQLVNLECWLESL